MLYVSLGDDPVVLVEIAERLSKYRLVRENHDVTTTLPIAIPHDITQRYVAVDPTNNIMVSLPKVLTKAVAVVCVLQ